MGLTMDLSRGQSGLRSSVRCDDPTSDSSDPRIAVMTTWSTCRSGPGPTSSYTRDQPRLLPVRPLPTPALPRHPRYRRPARRLPTRASPAPSARDCGTGDIPGGRQNAPTHACAATTSRLLPGRAWLSPRPIWLLGWGRPPGQQTRLAERPSLAARKQSLLRFSDPSVLNEIGPLPLVSSCLAVSASMTATASQTPIASSPG